MTKEYIECTSVYAPPETKPRLLNLEKKLHRLRSRRDRMNDWEKQLVSDMRRRAGRDNFRVSLNQLKIIERLYDQTNDDAVFEDLIERESEL